MANPHRHRSATSGDNAANGKQRLASRLAPKLNKTEHANQTAKNICADPFVSMAMMLNMAIKEEPTKKAKNAPRKSTANDR